MKTLFNKITKNVVLPLAVAGGLVLGGCGNEEEKIIVTQKENNKIKEYRDSKRNIEIELYNYLLESYMTSEDSSFQNIIAHYKRNATELKECRDNNAHKLEDNRGIYEIELKYIKKYSERREADKKETLEMSKKIKRKFDEL